MSLHGWCQTCGATGVTLCPHGYCGYCHRELCVSPDEPEREPNCDPHWSEPQEVPR